MGDRLGQANALTSLGVARRATADYLGAARDREEALGIYQDISSRGGGANALRNLGLVLQATGDYPNAARTHTGSLRE
jgi:Tetratricopeptide repeat